jgi:predicted transcriptional regulator
MTKTLVKDVMINKDKIITCNESEKLKKAVDNMWFYEVGSVIITNKENEFIGIMTNTDVLTSFSNGVDIETIISEKSDLLSKKFSFCQETNTLEEAGNILKENKTHHMLVQNDKKEITGLVSSLDLLNSKDTCNVSMGKYLFKFLQFIAVSGISFVLGYQFEKKFKK